jgi:eukaryotic-like serine/threonine-protein kinase
MVEQLGETLGRYRLDELVGHGGMAVVYRAVDTLLGRTVAVKVIRPAFAGDQQFLDRFVQEARLVASLDHPNVLPVFDFGEQEGSPFLVLPYLPGGTLANRLGGVGHPLPQVASWLGQLAGALDAAHARNILHRDVKPGNVLIGGDGRLVLGDFGIARLAEASTRLTATGMVVGTPLYMAPELACGSDASPSSDRYALAVMAYEMVAGKPPFSGANPLSILHQQVNDPVPRVADLRADLPPRVDDWLQRGLAKDPGSRYSSARSLVDELVELMTPEQRAELTTRVGSDGHRAVLVPDSEVPTIATPVTGVGAAAPPGARVVGTATAATAGPKKPSRYRWGIVGLGVAAAAVVAVLWLDPRQPATSGVRHAAGVADPAPASPRSDGEGVSTAAAEPGARVPAAGDQRPGDAVVPVATAAVADEDASDATQQEIRPASPEEQVADVPRAATLAEAREVLGSLRRPTRRWTGADFEALAGATATLAGDPRLVQPGQLGHRWALGGIAYAAGRDEEAERYRQELLAELAGAQANAPWGIAWPALAFRREDPALARAVLYADARHVLASLVARSPGEDRFVRALAGAYLAHLEGRHAAAAEVFTAAGVDPVGQREPLARTLAAQFLSVEAIEGGDVAAARRWLPLAAADATTPLVRPFMMEIAGLAQRALAPPEAWAVRAHACRVGVTQLCRGGAGEEAARAPAGARPRSPDREQERPLRRPLRRQPDDGGRG